ncbi:hypothetical protein Lser_V15G38895 [Lactuca serriola]
MATPPPSPDSISLNSRDRMNFNDMHTIFCDCEERMAETQVEMDRIKEEMGRDYVISRVEMLVVQSRLDCNDKKMQAMTVVLVGLMVVTLGFLVDKMHTLMYEDGRKHEISGMFLWVDAIIRTSTTRSNPGRPFYAFPKKDPGNRFICWVDEVDTTSTTGEAIMIATLHRSNKKLQSDVWKMKIVYFLV